MEYISLKEWAERNSLSERTARNYCAQGLVDGAVRIGRAWTIPVNACVPKKGKHLKATPLLKALREQKEAKIKGGIYHRVQVDLTYNSNHIEGSRLTHDQTRYIFETNTIGISSQAIKVDDIIETTNHFKAIDFIIDNTEGKLSETAIKHLHKIIKSGTSDESKDWFRAGDYKLLPNEVGGVETVEPKMVHKAVQSLLKEYNSIRKPTLEEIIDFHQRFEAIHPFQDGNGRVGRLIMFRECLQQGHVPFIITDELKMYYYNGLRNWPQIKGYLLDTCLTAQDMFKLILDRFKIRY